MIKLKLNFSIACFLWCMGLYVSGMGASLSEIDPTDLLLDLRNNFLLDSSNFKSWLIKQLFCGDGWLKQHCLHFCKSSLLNYIVM